MAAYIITIAKIKRLIRTVFLSQMSFLKLQENQHLKIELFIIRKRQIKV